MNIGEIQKFIDALEIARELNTPGEKNGEYTRGQAELICDLFGIPMAYRDDIQRVIAHEMPIGVLELGAFAL